MKKSVAEKVEKIIKERLVEMGTFLSWGKFQAAEEPLKFRKHFLS